MKKVYLLLTAICLAALTGCIKEDVELTEANVTMSISTRLDLSSVSSQEQGDAIADINVWAFACDADGNVTNATDPAVAWRRITTANTHTSVDVHLQFTTCKDNQPRHYKLVAVINKEAFGTITTTDGVTTFDRNTTYNQLANATFEAPADLMAMNPGHGPNSTPGQMPISHWTIITLDGDNDSDDDENRDTHPGECYKVSMPVYRALAKTQLLVAKSDANANVVIKNVTLGSSAYPTEGALLSAAAGTYDEAKNTAGDLTPSDTPLWYVSSTSIAKENKSNTDDVAVTTNEVDIFDPSTTNTGEVSADLTEDDHGSDDVDFDDYQYITSYFLYENAGGNGGAWNTASTNGGYYMDVTYDAGAGDKTERVWLPAVVRNHDIQVRALVNAGGKLELTFNVQPWTDISTSWNYTDVVTLNENGHLKWTTGSYEKIETDTETNVSTVTMKKVTSGSTTSYTNLECRFFIETPEDATWYASFVGGDINSFEFVGANSGSVGQEATLTIKAKNSTISTSQMAYLDIVIVTADGRTLKSSELTNGLKYQLVQNP